MYSLGPHVAYKIVIYLGHRIKSVNIKISGYGLIMKKAFIRQVVQGNFCYSELRMLVLIKIFHVFQK